MAEKINTIGLIEKRSRLGVIYFEDENGHILYKKCKECGIAKPLDDFNIAKKGLGERNAKCKFCVSKEYFESERIVRAAKRGKSPEEIGAPKFNQKTFEEEVKLHFGGKFTVIGKYVNTRTPIDVKNNGCGHKFPIRPYDLLRGRDCPDCNGKFRKTTNQFKKELFEVHGNEFTVLGEYITGKTPILVRHNYEGCKNHEFTPLPTNILRGQKCPACNESKGERQIKEWLDGRGVSYQSQFSFPGLKGIGGGLLRFDFAILDKDDRIKLLIEFDGIFHFEKRYDGDDSEKIQEHDRIKNSFCRSNNLKLLRIPYTKMDNLNEILNGAI